MEGTGRTEIVVIGAGYAGVAAALRCAGIGRARVRVTVVNPVDRFVERVRLHQAATGQVLRDLRISRLMEGRDASVVSGWVTAIDPRRCVVSVGTADGERRMNYDVVINATGSVADLDAVPGVREHACSLAGWDSACRLLAALRAASEGERVVVCGGGATGIETAAEIAACFPYLNVTLVTRGVAGGWLSERGRSHVVAALAAAGVTIINGAEVAAVRPWCVQLADDRSVPAGVVVWAGPFTARSLARDSGLACDASGRMLVDTALRSISYPNVIVAGDAALARGSGGAPARMACATALPMGVAAGDTALAVAAGQEPAAFANRYIVQCLSLGRRDALLQFLDPCDTPAPRVVTGRRAAWAKEVITRGTIWSLAALRRIPTVPLPGVLAAPSAAGSGADGIKELVTGPQR